MSNFSNFKIKAVEKCNTLSSNNTTTFKIDLRYKSNSIKKNVTVQFKVDDKVKHKEEGIIGKINFIGKDKLSVIWNDGTRERFALNDLSELAYVDDVEEMVSPLTNQSNETDKLVKKIQDTQINNEDSNTIDKSSDEQNKSELDKLFERAFDEMEDTYDDIEDANPNKLENQKLQRKIDTLEKKIENDKIANIKDSAIKDIIELMKSKGMIKDSEGEKIQRENLLKMDDVGFEAFKTAILSIDKNKKKQVEPTEAELMLQKIKSGGPIIGDFNSSSAISNSIDSPTRDLKSLNSSNVMDKTASSKQNPNLNFDGFKDLQGLTKPIQVVAEQRTPSQNIAEAISSMDWTTITKVF